MRLTQITIENFGIYKGINTFSFPYTEKKKVSVIIGKNGSGKTTFLNAVKTCYFGSMILRNRTITKSYEEFILNKLNKNAQKEALANFSIEATFVSHLHKFDGEFIIKRSWSVKTGKFEEYVSLKKNGKILSADEQEQFFNVMYHAFPLDLFDLFYLDGEKIDQLSVLNSNLIDLLESSINIDLFKNLRNDLERYAIKKVNSKQLESLEEIKLKTLTILDGYTDQVDQLNKKREFIEENIIKAKNNLVQFRNSLNITSITLDDRAMGLLSEKINEEKRDIQELLTFYLPYSLLKSQLKNIEANIDHEESSKKSQTIQSSMSFDLESHLAKKLGGDNQLIKNILSEIKKYYSVGNHNFIHRLNSEDYYNLKSKLSDIFNTNQLNLKQKMGNLIRLEQEAKKLSIETEELHAAEKSGQLDELLELQSKLSVLSLELDKTITEIAETNEKILKRKLLLDETEKEIWAELKKSNVNIVLEKLNNVLEAYIAQIKSDKIKLVEDQTKDMFDRLIRKEGFIRDFKIKDHMIYLLDDSGNQLDHSHLSAGEKQLFILSLIYAIIQSSERTVPMVFDTLLGRLDKGHRNNVFKEFIGSCPDQVIILATDSELANIDQEYLTSLTNIEYTIDFSKTEHQMIETR